MRTFITLLLLLVLLALGYLAYAHLSGGAVPSFGLPLGGEAARIRARCTQFFEHVKFKDNHALNDFLAKDDSPEELAHYIANDLDFDRKKLELEAMDIKDIELDSSQTRARVNIRLKGRDALTHKTFEREKIIYFYLSDKNIWLIDFKSY